MANPFLQYAPRGVQIEDHPVETPPPLEVEVTGGRRPGSAADAAVEEEASYQATLRTHPGLSRDDWRAGRIPMNTAIPDPNEANPFAPGEGAPVTVGQGVNPGEPGYDEAAASAPPDPNAAPPEEAIPEGPPRTHDYQTRDLGPTGTAFLSGVQTYFPWTDELASAVRAPIDSLVSGGSVRDNYMNRMRYLQEEMQDNYDRYPTATNVGTAGGVVTSFLPIGWAARANMGRNLLTTSLRTAALGGATAEAYNYGANPVDDRWNGGAESGVIGTTIGAVSPAAGRFVGGAARRVNERLGISERARLMFNRITGGGEEGADAIAERSAVDAMGTRTSQDPTQMRARAQEFRDTGHEPTLTNVVDESGRGMIAAAARRPGPGREVAQRAAEARALNLPDQLDRNMARATTEGVDPVVADHMRRPAGDLVDDLTEIRSSEIEQAMHPIRGEPVPVTPEVVGMLNTAEGRRAIGQAMRTMTDGADRNRLRDLLPLLRQVDGMNPRVAEQVMQSQGGGLTVDMADRIARRFNAMASTADPDAARVLRGFGRALRDNARDAVPAYREALERYGARSRSIGAVETGEDFLRPGTTDDFADRARRLSNEPNTEAERRFTEDRREPERRAGEDQRGPDDRREPDDMRTRENPRRAEDDTPEARAARGEPIYDPIAERTQDVADTFGVSEQEIGDAARAHALREYATENGITDAEASRLYHEAADPEVTAAIRDRTNDIFSEMRLGRREAVAPRRADEPRRTGDERRADIPRRVEEDQRAGQDRRLDYEDVMPTPPPLPSDRQLAQVGARRAVQRAAGESVRRAPDVARRIATAPEQMQRNNALFGPQRAEELERAMSISEDDVRHFAQIAPNTGSQTAIRGTDDEAAAGVLSAMAHASGGGRVAAIMSALRNLGLRDQDAARIVNMAVDPARTDELIGMLEQSYGRQRAAEIGQALGLTTGAQTGSNLAQSR